MAAFGPSFFCRPLSLVENVYTALIFTQSSFGRTTWPRARYASD